MTCSVSDVQQSDSATDPSFQILYHYGLIQDTEYNSPCCTVGPCFPSVFFISLLCWGFPCSHSCLSTQLHLTEHSNSHCPKAANNPSPQGLSGRPSAGRPFLRAGQSFLVLCAVSHLYPGHSDDAVRAAARCALALTFLQKQRFTRTPLWCSCAGFSWLRNPATNRILFLWVCSDMQLYF